MTDLLKDVPRRAAYKAAEVCEIAHIQPYVLRSWESEFPKLGLLRGGARIYRHADLEQVLRIKQLLFEEGLTLAGARRRIEDEAGPQADLPLEQFVTPEMKQRVTRVKQALRDLLAMLGRDRRAGAETGQLPEPGGNGRPSSEAVPAPAAIAVVSAAPGVAPAAASKMRSNAAARPRAKAARASGAHRRSESGRR